MTEKEWLKAKTLDFVDLKRAAKRSQRKMRLFNTGCCRRAAELIANPLLLPLLEASDQYADGEIPVEKLKKGAKSLVAVQKVIDEEEYPDRPDNELRDCLIALRGLTHKYIGFDLHTVYYARHAIRAINWRSRRQRTYTQAWNVEEKHQLQLARCIFGNPFRPVVFSPSWRSESAVALARTAYETRDFTLLPVLADALEETGCDSADVLTHCRDPKAVHARGCWVVDLVLGKS